MSTTTPAAVDLTATDADSLGVPLNKPAYPAQTTHYHASWGRRLALTTLLTIVIPFLVAMPIMVVMRLSRGFIVDGLTLAFFAGIFMFAFGFLFLHAKAAWKTRFALTEKALFMTAPKWRGPNPGWHYVHYKVPYENIARIERRCELFSEVGVPVMMEAFSIVSDDNQRFVLGYQVDDDADPAFPFVGITEEVSRRSAIPITDRGCHNLGSQYKMLVSRTAQDWEREPDITHETYRRMKTRNHAVMTIFATVLIVAVAIGIYLEIQNSSFTGAAVNLFGGS